jgi:ferredoxin
VPDVTESVLRVDADRDLCIGSGVCVFYAPDSFTQDDDSKVVLLRPNEEADQQVRAAVDGCPTSALTLTNSENAT